MKITKGLFFFLLMPLYLVMVYYKTVYESDVGGLLVLSVVMLIVYLPFASVLARDNEELSIYSLLDNEEADSYLNRLFLFLGVFGIIVCVIFAVNFFHINLARDARLFNAIVALSVYITWILLTHRLFLIWLESDTLNFVKMGFMLFLIIGLFLAKDITGIREEFGFSYILTLLWLIVKDIFFLAFLMPSFFIYMFGFISEKGVGNLGLLALLFTPPGFLFGYIMFVLFIQWFSGFVNSFNSYNVALALSISMIVISAVGTYFQLQIFMGTFFRKNAQKLSYVFLGVFYAVMMVHMNIVDTVEKNSRNIRHTQWEIKHLNKKLQGFMNSKI